MKSKTQTDTSHIFPVNPKGITLASEPVYLVPRGIVKPRKKQPRTEHHEKRRTELAASIKELRGKGQGYGGTGILQPLECTWEPGAILDGGSVKPGAKLLINIGETRYWATEDIGDGPDDVLPVKLSNASEQQAFENAIYENVARKDLSPKELANAIWKWKHSCSPPLTNVVIAKKLGKTQSWLSTILAPFNLSPDIADLYKKRLEKDPDAHPDTPQRIDRVKDPKLREKLLKMYRTNASDLAIRKAITEGTKKEEEEEEEEEYVTPHTNIENAMAAGVTQIDWALDALRGVEGKVPPRVRGIIKTKIKNIRKHLESIEELL